MRLPMPKLPHAGGGTLKPRVKPRVAEGVMARNPTAVAGEGAFSRAFLRLLSTSIPRFLNWIGALSDYQYGTLKVGSLRITIGSLSFTA